MPNHVINKLYVHDSDSEIKYADICAFMKGDECDFDFNKLIPSIPDDPDWYDWRVNNWGTKWNAYEISFHDNCIKFLTAWTMPQQVTEALSMQFPDCMFVHDWADEDLGFNCGTGTIKGGYWIEMDFEDDYTFACNLWGYDPDPDVEEAMEEQNNA